MRKVITVLSYVMILAACNENHAKLKAKLPTDSINQKSIDSQMAKGDRPDSEQEGPSITEVRTEYLKSYNKIDKIDTLIIDGKDSLHVHCKYYCLHDSTLVVPKKYIWGEKNPTDFTTNNFASNIIIIKNRDTILNKTFRKGDFMDVIKDESLKKYAIIFSPSLYKYNREKGEFTFSYSISIPLTDVGVPAYIITDKKGGYKILNEYAVK